MYTKDALDYYGKKNKIAKALNISTPAVTNWGDVVPKLRAFELSKLTKGKLKVNEEAYKKAD